MAELKLIGTSHISQKSVDLIKSNFASFQPDIIAVELDKQRLYALLHNLQPNLSISNISKIGLTGYLFLVLGRYLQKKLGMRVGMEPGVDMKFAVNLAKENNKELALIDQNIQITLTRLSKKFNFKAKLRLVKLLFSKQEKVKINLSDIPDQELIDKLMNELRKNFPEIYSVIVDERNKYMAKQLFKLKQFQDKKILAVVGAGHITGISAYLKHYEQSNISL